MNRVDIDTHASTHTQTGRGSRGWEGQWKMGGAVGDGRGSGRWEGQ